MLLLIKWADNDGIILLMVVCTSAVQVVEFKACEIVSLDQRYTYSVIQTIWMKLILLCVWAKRAVLGSAKTALKFKYNK